MIRITDFSSSSLYLDTFYNSCESIGNRFLRSFFRVILSRMKDVTMYYRKSSTARSDCFITALSTLEIPKSHLTLWDRISQREETVILMHYFPMAAGKEERDCAKGCGRQPAITPTNGSTLKEPKSHYQKKVHSAPYWRYKEESRKSATYTRCFKLVSSVV